MSHRLPDAAAPERPLLVRLAPLGGGLAAAVIATLSLNSTSAWNDEAATLSAVDRPAGSLFELLLQIDAVHGLYYWIMHLWVEVAGTSVFSLRFPSAILYGLTASAIVWMVALITGDSVPATLFGVVGALTLPGLTWASTSARTFALAALLCTLNALILLLATREERPRLGLATCFAFVIPLMVLAEVYSLLVVPSYLWLCWGDRRRSATACRRAGMVGTGLAVILVGVIATQRGQLSPTTSLSSRIPGVALGAFFMGLRNGERMSVWHYGSAVALALLFLGLCLVGVARHRDRVSAFLVTWAALPPLALFAISLALPAMFTERYLVISAPAVVVLAARGVTVIHGVRRAPLLAALSCAVLSLPLQLAQRGDSAKAGHDLRTFARSIAKQRPTAIWYDAGSGRGASIVYPESFPAVVDVRRKLGPIESNTLWGRDRSASESARLLVRDPPKKLAVAYLTARGPGASSGIAAAQGAGCVPLTGTQSHYYSLAYFTCAPVTR